jgi:hypothetical protein
MEERATIGEVALSMLIKPQYLIPVFILTVLCVIFFSIKLLAILLVTGSIFLYAAEVMIYLQLKQYKKIKENMADMT